MKDFDVETVELKGSNLVEASAGTGKTFSLAILALRLIIEKDISISKILMVTFTNAAVAELESRIREFVRLAYKVSKGEEIDNDVIIEVVEKQQNKEIVKERLSKAIRELQNTSILTIHSFCQETLTEFAFETNQIYGAETIENTDDIVLSEVYNFWRTNISIKDIEELSLLKDLSVKIGTENYKKLGIQIFKTVLHEKLKGKKFRGKIIAQIDKELRRIYIFLSNKLDKKDVLYRINDGIENVPRFTANTARPFIEYLNADDIINFYKEIFKGSAQSKRNVFTKEFEYKNIFDIYITYENIKNNNEDKLNEVFHDLIKVTDKVVELYLQKNNLITFDDLIKNVHTAVTNNGTDIIEQLQNKYEAVFIDEFQDTDKLQYEIFDTVFHGSSILFYIGDPKQSIYGWRKADLNVYFSAKDKVGNNHIFTMNTNFRSSKNYVEAMNKFFLPSTEFDTFLFGNNNGIKYIKVTAKAEESYLKIDGDEIKPISIFDYYTNKTDINKDTANLVLSLLIKGKLKNKEVNEKSIGILVRTGWEGKEIKKELQKLKIPAITIDDQKIFESDEAKNLLYILETVNEISWKRINKALLTPFTKLKSQDLLKLDDSKEVEKFKYYNKTWNEKGVYAMMLKFISDYSIKSDILDNKKGGERIISNLYQLIEILQRAETENKYSTHDLISFLSRRISGLKDENDEYTQRIESDENAVTIMTIHKSKGLEFDIVIAPFLDFVVEEKFGFSSYRDEDAEYCFVPNKQLLDKEELWRNQQEQENRRLLYVAITRAKYNCFIFKNNPKQSTLKYFYDELVINKKGLINHISFSNYKNIEGNYKTNIQKYEHKETEIPEINLADRHWRKMSYSYLAGVHQYFPKEIKKDAYPEDRYSQFIFKDLPRGAHVGNLLHNIFEFIDFKNSKDGKWSNIINISLKQFLPKFQNEINDNLLSMVNEVVDANIEFEVDGFSLADIGMEQRKSEIEFDINVSRFKIDSLLELQSQIPKGFEINTRNNEDIEGVLNGFVDLFFEHNGKFYVLDWKSNFLGDTLDDYTNDKLITAMNESNYHLQYLIYTMAMKKYLESKLPNFDYETQFGGAIYIFLRGVRKGTNNGVFTHKPSIELIEKLENILN